MLKCFSRAGIPVRWWKHRMQATDPCKIDFPGSQGRSVSWSYFVFVSGQGSSGSKVYSGMNITIGDLVVVCEWILSSLHAGPQMRRTLSITDNQQQDPQARLMKQVWFFASGFYSVINWKFKTQLTREPIIPLNFFVLLIILLFVLFILFILLLFRVVPFPTKGYFLPKQLSHDATIQISSPIKNKSDFCVLCFHS